MYSDFQFLFDLIYLVPEMLIGVDEIVDSLTCVKYSGMILPADM